MAITGPSGCGKSTLLAVLLGFVTPDRRVGDGGRRRAGGARSRRLAAAAGLDPATAAPVRGPDRRQRPPGPARTRAPRRGQRGRRRGRPGRVVAGAPGGAGDRGSASAGPGCRPASASASRWRGRSCATLRCCCSTSRRPTSTATPRTKSWPTLRRLLPGRTALLVAHRPGAAGAGRPSGRAGPAGGGRVMAAIGAARPERRDPGGRGAAARDGWTLARPGRRRRLAAGHAARAPAPSAPGIGLIGHVGLADLPGLPAPAGSALALAIVGVQFFGLSRGLFRYGQRLVGHDAALPDPGRPAGARRTRGWSAGPGRPARLPQRRPAGPSRPRRRRRSRTSCCGSSPRSASRCSSALATVALLWSILPAAGLILLGCAAAGRRRRCRG